MGFVEVLQEIKHKMIEGCSSIYNIGNEGYTRKEIHLLCETDNKIAVYCFSANKSKADKEKMLYNAKLRFSFYKVDIGMTQNQTIDDMCINPTADNESIILVLRNDGELKFVNEKLLKLTREIGNPVR